MQHVHRHTELEHRYLLVGCFEIVIQVVSAVLRPMVLTLPIEGKPSPGFSVRYLLSEGILPLTEVQRLEVVVITFPLFLKRMVL